MPASCSSDKKNLRAQLLAARHAITHEYARNASISVTEQLLTMIPPHATIAGYYATQGELNIIPALEKFAANDHRIALPAINKESRILSFLEWQLTTPLITGAFNIPCPPPTANIIIPDVVIIPLLGFDAHGNRLGFGAGYYDATLSHLKTINNAIKYIGVAYSMQQIPRIPREPHDQQLNIIITEKEMIEFT